MKGENLCISESEQIGATTKGVIFLSLVFPVPHSKLLSVPQTSVLPLWTPLCAPAVASAHSA